MFKTYLAHISLLLFCCFVYGCNKYDYQAIESELEEIESRDQSLDSIVYDDTFYSASGMPNKGDDNGLKSQVNQSSQDSEFDLFAGDDNGETEEPRVLTDKEIREPSPIPSLFDTKTSDAVSRNYFPEGDDQSATPSNQSRKSQSSSVKPMTPKMDSHGWENRLQNSKSNSRPEGDGSPRASKGPQTFDRQHPPGSSQKANDPVTDNSSNQNKEKKGSLFENDANNSNASRSSVNEPTGYDYRNFVDREGKTQMWAQLVGIEEDKILIRGIDGKKFRIAIKDLSENDVAYLSGLGLLGDQKDEAREYVFDDPQRTYTDVKGEYKVDGRLESYQAGEIRLRHKNGDLIKIQLRRLSKQDQKYVNQRIRFVKSRSKD